jgi:hypothetical protein
VLSVYLCRSYSARKSHAPCCRLCSDRLYNIFAHNLINNTIFGEKNMEHKMYVFVLFTNIEIFIILSKADRDVIKMVIGFHVK